MRTAAVALGAILSISGTVAAQPAPDGASSGQVPFDVTISKALDSVVKVEARDCSESPANRLGTGFAVSVGGATYLVTALHVVANCKTIALQDSVGKPASAKLVKLAKRSDLAILEVTSGVLGTTPLRLSKETPPPDIQLQVLGFGGNLVKASGRSARTVVAQSALQQVAAQNASSPTGQVQLPPTALQTLELLIGNQSVSDLLRRQGFPSGKTAVLVVQGGMLAGDSGGPVIDKSGEVAGVANGGLLAGLAQVNWVMPASEIRELVTGGVAPSEASVVVTGVLLAEEIAPKVVSSEASVAVTGGLVAEEVALKALPSAAPGTPLPVSAAQASVRCGSDVFFPVGAQKLDDALASANDLSKRHAKLALDFAKMNGQQVPGSRKFTVYIGERSGATFGLPDDFSWSPQQVSGQCLAVDSTGEVEIRVASNMLLNAQVPPAVEANPHANALLLSVVPRGEVPITFPQYTSNVVGLPNGTALQRTGIAFGPKETLACLPFDGCRFTGPSNESYGTHLARQGEYFGLVVSSRKPFPGLRKNGFYGGVVAAYLANM